MASIPTGLPLTAGVRAALPFLTALSARPELSASQILRETRAAGFSVQTQQALDVIGALRDSIDNARAIRLTPPDQPVNPAFYTPTIGQLNFPYSFLVLARGTDPLTGLPVNKNVTVTSTVPLSQQQILATAESYATGQGRSGGTINVSLSITEFRVSPDALG